MTTLWHMVTCCWRDGPGLPVEFDSPGCHLGPWETTGFVSDLDWAEANVPQWPCEPSASDFSDSFESKWMQRSLTFEHATFPSHLGRLCVAQGRRLTPCLAFRDEGAYRVSTGAASLSAKDSVADFAHRSGWCQVRVVQIGAMPPLDVQKVRMPRKKCLKRSQTLPPCFQATRQDAKVTDWRTSWSDFDWEAASIFPPGPPAGACCCWWQVGTPEAAASAWCWRVTFFGREVHVFSLNQL